MTDTTDYDIFGIRADGIMLKHSKCNEILFEDDYTNLQSLTKLAATHSITCKAH